MVTHSWDASGEARAALDAVVRDYGTAALSSPQILVSLLKDLMPDSPRESSVLVAAAEANVAGLLQDRLAQHVSTAAAVTQAAALLEQRTALAPDACQWAAWQMAEMLGLPRDAGPASGQAPPQPLPQPPPQPQTQPPSPAQAQYPPQPHVAPLAQTQPPASDPWLPGPRPSPPTPRGPAVVAASSALVCALSVPLQLLGKNYVNMPYGWLIALFGLILFSAGVLTLRGNSRNLGVGLIFGASLASVTNFVEVSMVSGFGGGLVAASVITTVTALIAAISSVVYFARQIHAQNLRAPLAAMYCLAALGFVVAFNPGGVQFRVGSHWVTYPGFVGPGVTGRFLFAGIVALAALSVPAVIAGLLPPGTGVRAGVITGWLAIDAAGLLAVSLNAGQPFQRPAPGLYASWAVWVITLLLGIALATDNRSRQAVNAPSTLVQ
jgi:hypothetical protein